MHRIEIRALYRKYRTAPLVLVWMIWAAGCASTGSLEPPDLTLVDLRPTEATLFETTLVVRMRITNPNPDPLAIEGASLKLTLNDRKIGRGQSSEAVTVPMLSSEVVDLTFHISNATVAFKLQEILEQKSLTYGLSGKVYVQTSLGTKKLKVEHQGSFDLGESTPVNLETNN